MRRSCLTARIALNYACGSGANLNEMKHKEYLAALLTTVLGIAMRLEGHFVLCQTSNYLYPVDGMTNALTWTIINFKLQNVENLSDFHTTNNQIRLL